MKQFACGSLVQGCQAVFDGDREQDILAQVEVHAKESHQLTEVSSELVEQVRANIKDA